MNNLLSLLEETLPKKKKGILFLDIDDTLLKPVNVKIYRRLPSDSKEVALTPEEYARERVTSETKRYYDYRDFRDVKKIENSIKNGIPYIHNLKVVDDFYNGGYDIGILTARGAEDAVYRGVNKFLKVRNKEGRLVQLKIPRKLFFAVNDSEKEYAGKTDYEKKKNILRKFARSNYDFVYFIDDDDKNLKSVKRLKRELDPVLASKLRTIKAIKKKIIEESTYDKVFMINEMAMKDFEKPAVIDNVKSGNYKEAMKNYLLTVKKTKKYQKTPWHEFIQKMGSYGAPRTFAAAEKKGIIEKGVATKLIDTLRNVGADEFKTEKIISHEESDKEAEKEKKKKIVDIKKENSKFSRLSGYWKEMEVIEDRVKNLEHTVFPLIDAVSDSSGYLKMKKGPAKTEYVEKIKKYYEELPTFIKKLPLTANETAFINHGKEIENKIANRTKVYFLKIDKLLTDAQHTFRLLSNTGRSENPNFSREELLNFIVSDPLFKDKEIKALSEWKSNLKIKRKKDQIKFSNRANVSLTKIGTSYINYLKELDKAKTEGKLLEFTKKHLKAIKAMINDSTIGKSRDDKAHLASKITNNTLRYKKPDIKDIDNNDVWESTIYEDEEEEKNADFLKRTSLLPDSIKKIDLRRQEKGQYQGKERDASDIKTLTNFVLGREKDEEKVFRILANIGLDFLDGLRIVATGTNLSLLKVDKTFNSELEDGKTKVNLDTKKRYDEVKDTIIKNGAEAYDKDPKANPQYKKYKDAYLEDPKAKENEKKRKIESIKKVIKSFGFSKLKKNGIIMQGGVGINKYSEDKMLKLYDAYDKGDEEDLINLLKTPEYKNF